MCFKIARTCNNQVRDESVLDRELKNYVDRVFKTEQFNIIPGVEFEKLNVTTGTDCDTGRSQQTSFEDYIQDKFDQYAKTHVLSVNFEQTARFFSFSSSNTSTGKHLNLLLRLIY